MQFTVVPKTEAHLDVLLVEDDELVLETLCEALHQAGLDTERHQTAESALLAVSRERPKIVVTDINLGPGMDGLALGRAVRSRFPDLPFVYISGRYSELRGLSAQERFLIKPFPATLLLRAIHDLAASPARDMAV